MRIQPLRDGTIQDRTQLRLRLNELIEKVNETASRWVARRIPNVQTGVTVTLASPGFNVGAITIGGVNPTAGAAIPTVAPWVSNWVQQTDGRITMAIGGLAASPALFAVNLVLFEQETP